MMRSLVCGAPNGQPYRHNAEWISCAEAGAVSSAAIQAARDNAVQNVLVVDLLISIRFQPSATLVILLHTLTRKILRFLEL